MASTQSRPEPGDTLVVIHAFQARSSDELTLAKGDKVELIESDDEFGDGWFLGRHLTNGNTGLFPEVYTRPAQRQTPSSAFNASKPLSPLPETSHDTNKQLGATNESSAPKSYPTPPPAAADVSSGPSAQPLPLISTKSETSTPPIVARNKKSNSSLNRAELDQDNQVLNDTLNVIDEHITHLRTAPSTGALRSANNDSGSEYSAPLDRLSYIQGEETDEEEVDGPTREEVQKWDSARVADHLYRIGVEKHHCDVFRDQEITGEVLLGMEQNSLFIKEFDLGSVGRRLKTWHKIKAFQDETTGGFGGTATRRTTQTYGSEVTSEDYRHSRSRTDTMGTSSTAGGHRPTSIHTSRLSSSHTPRMSSSMMNTSPKVGALEPSNRPSHTARPSAASVRDLGHSRRHSTSTDYRVTGSPSGPTTPRLTSNGTFPLTDATHKKQPSFDRNWSLGHAFTSRNDSYGHMPRPLSSTELPEVTPGSESEPQDSAVDFDRGYFSGTEAEGRRRVLHKSKASASTHRARNSYAEEQRVRSATALSRHSRFGSVDSVREGAQGSAAQKYYGSSAAAHRRTASTNTQESYRPPPPAKDSPAPTVTKLDGSSATPPSKHGFRSEWFSKPIGKAGSGMRAISDNLSFDRKPKAPVEPPPKESISSPARTSSGTGSAGPSFDIESPDAVKSPSTALSALSSKRAGRKGKKDTSAYQKGLLRIPPRIAAQEAEYSGWMRKKSSNLMTTWKPRFFVLKGRRLGYYYSEDDDGEKGLIDISFHRVLPADNERLTGLHATISGVVDRSKEGHDELQKGDDSMFIFKLVPPRAGLNKAVNFTKPTIHYFAVPNLQQGRLWMAALMKATIDRDDTQPLTSTYQQKTISLAKARQMRHRPPALMNLEEGAEQEPKQASEQGKDAHAPGTYGETDSGVSGMDKRNNQGGDSTVPDQNYGQADAASRTTSATQNTSSP